MHFPALTAYLLKIITAGLVAFTLAACSEDSAAPAAEDLELTGTSDSSRASVNESSDPDDDFTYLAPSNGTLTITLSDFGDGNTIDLDLFANGLSGPQFSTSFNPVEIIVMTVTAGETVTITVDAFSTGNTTVSYLLEVNLVP